MLLNTLKLAAFESDPIGLIESDPIGLLVEGFKMYLIWVASFKQYAEGNVNGQNVMC
ncbi:MAG: hypothetical protein L3J28_10750 [Candidatus Polarisedimenticolaceae bacterium]|nr:hypothetical protein [Candidatus Polarisedimenticolaceae bacterium]